jgi:ribosomal protein S12 methylthiotransferase accessory factor
MCGEPLMERWYASPYTGLFSRFGPLPLRPYDPAVPVWAGMLPPWGARGQELAVGGAGWDAAAAEAACVGEAIERLQPYRLPADRVVFGSFAAWPLDEPAVPPERWVLFHPEQYAAAGFPFRPLTAATDCTWVCFREALTGDPWWVPAELAYLFLEPGAAHAIAPAVSTGLSCGRIGDPVLLRGLQEVLERDAVVGAWWGTYPLEEWPADHVFDGLGPALRRRLERPNLRYRFYRVSGGFSAHVTIVTVEGEDVEGYCFSAGSACRETRRAAWLKAVLEAVHARHYVRYLLRQRPTAEPPGVPTSFPDHAVYYSLRPEALEGTVLRRAAAPSAGEEDASSEDLATLAARLGPDRPVLFRNMTPPAIAQAQLGWYVLRVVVPGLQPLHGDHRLPHLGGPLWAPRGLHDWAGMPPHPFP